MKIAIIGAGALGSLFGGLLAERGQEVWLFDPLFKEHIREVKAKGLVVEESGKERRIEVKATTDVREIGEVDLVAIFVKAQHTEEAVKGAMPTISRETQVLSLQNGLGIEEHIAKYVDGDRILRGVTAQGSTLIRAGKIRHAGRGETRIGKLTKGGDERKLRRVIEAFNHAGIETRYEEDVERLVWEKLLINAAINALTAIFNVKNGELVTDKDLNDVMHAIVWEAVKVARVCGMDIHPHHAIRNVEEVCRITSENISSMLQDVRAGRETEIDHINGAIVKKGEGLGVEVPLNKLLVKLVKLKELDQPVSASSLKLHAQKQLFRRSK